MIDNYKSEDWDENDEGDWDEEKEGGERKGLLGKVFHPVVAEPLPVPQPFPQAPTEAIPVFPVAVVPPIGEPTAGAEEDIEDFVGLSNDDREFLFGTEDIDPNTGEDFLFPTNEGIDEMIQPSESEKEFMFGTGESKPRKVKYTVNRKIKSKSRYDINRNDEFLFRTKGIL